MKLEEMIKDNYILNNELSLTSDFEELSKIRDFVFSHAEASGFNELDASKISLAVDEACTNIIRHSYKLEPNKSFSIRIETNGKFFIVTIIDDGNPFNPLDFPKPDMDDYMKKFKRGGLGIHIIRSIMDEVSYFPSNDSNLNNILQLKKVLP